MTGRVGESRNAMKAEEKEIQYLLKKAEVRAPMTHHSINCQRGKPEHPRLPLGLVLK
jgi:hypothetical protein